MCLKHVNPVCNLSFQVMNSCLLKSKLSNTLLRQNLNQIKLFNSLIQNECHVLDEMPQRGNISLHRSMQECLWRNDRFQALDMFRKHVTLGIDKIDEAAMAQALKACRGELKYGCQIHGFAVRSGFVSCLSVSNALMSLYCKCRKLSKALCIFQNMNDTDIVSWNTVLSGFDNWEESLSFASYMHSIGVAFDPVTCSTILSHCTNHEQFLSGVQMHAFVHKLGLKSDIFIGNALITLYSKWLRVMDAEKVFDEMTHRDLVSWNAMLSGYAQEGTYGLEAIQAFVEMKREGMNLDHVSFTSVVSACYHERELELGKQIHCIITKKGFTKHVALTNVLISMYSKCGCIKESNSVFESMDERNVISWTTMISIDEENAVYLYKNMRNDGVYPNLVTFVNLIRAIVTKNMVQEGLMVHAFCIKASFIYEVNVANSFITMYAKFKSIQDSEKIFHELENKESVSYNALISGYAQNGFFEETLKLFLSARTILKPSEHAFGSVLNAIGAAESISLRHGQCYHCYLIKLGFNNNPIVSGSLLDMYAKRGSISESVSVFQDIQEKTLVSWTTIISAQARHGDYESVMDLFEKMEMESIKPDSITFLSVLTACSRKGMVNKGLEMIDLMVDTHLIEPSAEHYSCMVDMLGRAGRLKEAEDFLRRFPNGSNRLSVLQSLLGHCRTHGDVDMGRRISDALMQLEPTDSGCHVLMSNLYADKGDWENVAKIRKGMREKGVKKEIGFSWVDALGLDNSISSYGFSSYDKSHPLSEEIYSMAKCLGSEMRLSERILYIE